MPTIVTGMEYVTSILDVSVTRVTWEVIAPCARVLWLQHGQTYLMGLIWPTLMPNAPTREYAIDSREFVHARRGFQELHVNIWTVLQIVTGTVHVIPCWTTQRGHKTYTHKHFCTKLIGMPICWLVATVIIDTVGLIVHKKNVQMVMIL